MVEECDKVLLVLRLKRGPKSQASLEHFSKVLVFYHSFYTLFVRRSTCSGAFRPEKRKCFLFQEVKNHFSLELVHCLSWKHCSSIERKGKKKADFFGIFIGWDFLVCILFHVSIFLKKPEKAETDNTNVSTTRNGIAFSRDFYPGEEATRLRIELLICKKKKEKRDRLGMAT